MDKLFQAVKSFNIGGADFRPGDPIDLSDLPDHKVGQLLNQRFIAPIPPDVPADGGTP